MDVSVVSKRSLTVVKLVMGLPYRNRKVVEFMIEFHTEVLKEVRLV